ncbi:RNA-directed DNA polymerase, eukaryota, reverse transcriptase zinc-binding domain protein [Tanacetum coccineum]
MLFGGLSLKSFMEMTGGFNSSHSSLGCNGTWLDIIKRLDQLVITLPFGDRGQWFDPYPLQGRKSFSTVGRTGTSLSTLGDHYLWKSWTPRKVNIGVWRASLNHLATRVNLLQRGIHITSVRCPFCDSNDEDVNRVLIFCSRVLPVWSWWNLDPPVLFPSFYVSDVASGNLPVNGDTSLAKVHHDVFQIALWILWNWRNRVVHAPINMIDKCKEEDVFPSIQRISHLWISSCISAKKKANLACWTSRPFELFL